LPEVEALARAQARAAAQAAAQAEAFALAQAEAAAQAQARCFRKGFPILTSFAFAALLRSLNIKTALQLLSRRA
jgi:hypothetical protein